MAPDSPPHPPTIVRPALLLCLPAGMTEGGGLESLDMLAGGDLELSVGNHQLGPAHLSAPHHALVARSTCAARGGGTPGPGAAELSMGTSPHMPALSHLGAMSFPGLSQIPGLSNLAGDLGGAAAAEYSTGGMPPLPPPPPAGMAAALDGVGCRG